MIIGFGYWGKGRAMCWKSAFVDGHTAARLRREIGHFLETYMADGDMDLSELILGELLGNVARHAPGPMCVDVDWRDDEPTLVVHDAGPGFTLSESDPDDDAEHGRGLYLIKQYARQFSAERLEAGGMRVCAKLPIARSDDVEAPACPYQSPYRSGSACPYPTSVTRV